MPMLTQTTCDYAQKKMTTSAALSNVPPSFDRTSVNSLPLWPMSASGTGVNRIYVGMSEVSAADPVDDDLVSQAALQHHLAAQAAITSRQVKRAERGEWAAAAVGIALLAASLGTVVVASAAHVWP